MGNLFIKQNKKNLDIFIDNSIQATLTEDTIKQNNLLIFNRKEAIDFFSKKIIYTPVVLVVKQYEKKLKSILSSNEDIFLIDIVKDKVYAKDIDSQEFLFFLKTLIDFQNSDYNFLTLIDNEESQNGKEFIYAQLEIPNGYICENDLIDEVFDMCLINKNTQEHYTREEIEEIGVYMVLLDHFTLRKDKSRLELGEY